MGSSHYPTRCNQRSLPLARQVDQRGECRSRNSIFGIVDVAADNNSSNGGLYSQEAKGETPFHLFILVILRNHRYGDMSLIFEWLRTNRIVDVGLLFGFNCSWCVALSSASLIDFQRPVCGLHLRKLTVSSWPKGAHRWRPPGQPQQGRSLPAGRSLFAGTRVNDSQHPQLSKLR